MRHILSSFTFLLLIAQPVSAADFFRGPVSSALAGAGRAGITGGEAVLVNPALLPLIKDFEFGVIYRDGDEDVGQHRQGWSVGAVDDSKDAYFPGSLHYIRTRETGRTDRPVNGEIWHAGAAYLVNNQLSVGLSGYRLVSEVQYDRDYTQWNFSLGMVYLVNDDLAFAYVLDNIANPGGAVPMGLRQDMQQGLGMFYRVAEIATLRADIARRERFNPDKEMTYMFGFESAMSEYFVMRLGYRREELEDRRFWTAGVGFSGPRLRVNYSFEKNQERVSGALHSVDMQVPF